MDFLKGLSKEEFLNNYWEKKPFVFRGALDKPEEFMELQDILDMSTDKFFESRCVSKEGNQWNVENGPFESERFQNKTKIWTLISHNLNLYIENVFQLVKELDFLPRWLFDDAMSTYSTKNSSVGAHIDNYNVFIIQITGKRLWEIEYLPKKEFQEGLDVRILKEFNPDTTYTLIPGDMIYIPPHVAHHGTSKSESLSLSLGYKSLEDKKLIEQFSLETLNSFESEEFYKTSFNHPLSDTHLISDTIIEDLHTRLLNEFKNKERFRDFILKLTSTPNSSPEESPDSSDNASLLENTTTQEFTSLFKSTPLYKDEFLRFSAYQDRDAPFFHVSINEHLFKVDEVQYELLKEVVDATSEIEITRDRFQALESILFSLYKKKILFFS